MSFNLSIIFGIILFLIGWYGGKYSGFLEAANMGTIKTYHLETKLKHCMEVIRE